MIEHKLINFTAPQAIWEIQTQLNPVMIIKFDILKYIGTNLLLEIHLPGLKIHSDVNYQLIY